MTTFEACNADYTARYDPCCPVVKTDHRASAQNYQRQEVAPWLLSRNGLTNRASQSHRSIVYLLFWNRRMTPRFVPRSEPSWANTTVVAIHLFLFLSFSTVVFAPSYCISIPKRVWTLDDFNLFDHIGSHLATGWIHAIGASSIC